MIQDPVTNRIEPIRKSITVAVPRERAFAVFTRRMDAWWPFAGHSMFEEKSRGVAFDPRVGGLVEEIDLDGNRAAWGRLLAWDPPASFRMTWHPGREESSAQELEVRFIEVPEGTRVELEHRGWENLRERGAEARGGYDQGWGSVLDAYVAACADGVQ